MASLVRSVRRVEAAMGSGVKRPTEAEEKMKKVARRSIVARVTLHAGTRLTERMLTLKRPGTGLEPEMLDRIIGMRTNRPIAADQTIAMDMLSED
jgi:sialic acid synthase SpsE